jgi:hypothetical protein
MINWASSQSGYKASIKKQQSDEIGNIDEVSYSQQRESTIPVQRVKLLSLVTRGNDAELLIKR